MIDYDIPFTGNSPDDMHCLQASYLMIRHFFEPEAEVIPWDAWASLTGFVPGKGTWSNAGLMWFMEHGYDVTHISTFDYAQFALDGLDYLIEALGEHVGKWEAEFIVDPAAEQSRALQFLKTGAWIKREPTIEDIYSYLNDGYLIKCQLNMKTLNGEPGYLGHAVVVKGYTSTGLILHDPGLPPQPNRHVTVARFLEAWTNPATGTRKLDAIRKAAPPPTLQRRSGACTQAAHPIATA